ncbi:hypothetical protein O181_035366 [Austropuccinia psidii MF-1]|uniref:Uncharacterized protein n=1 Tax=Austropuccinia psidii MF-1 TaxID=1389203 RepID=A0A9Q3D855_9BASI|nr:hypothetical protein [Austropuccinia psidii MF-1]
MIHPLDAPWFLPQIYFWLPPRTQYPPSPAPSSPNSKDEACQEFTDLRPTLMIPRDIVHKSINRILLEHRQLLHMIPFVDAAHRNEMHW